MMNPATVRLIALGLLLLPMWWMPCLTGLKVLCIGQDGHLALELGEGDCCTVESSSGPARVASLADDPCRGCTDFEIPSLLPSSGRAHGPDPLAWAPASLVGVISPSPVPFGRRTASNIERLRPPALALMPGTAPLLC